MLQFNNVVAHKFYMTRNQSGNFETSTPISIKHNPTTKKLAVKKCTLSNSFVPLFIAEPYTNETSVLPDGHQITIGGSATNLMIGQRTSNNGVFTYSGQYLNFDPLLNDSRSTNKLDYNYYYVYSLNKLCNWINTGILNINNWDSQSSFFNYEPSLNTFVLNVADSVLTSDIVVNKKFIDKFPFNSVKINDDLYVLDFSNQMPNIMNNILYRQLTSYVPYSFIPFDSVILTTDMPIINQTIYSNVNAFGDMINEKIMTTFDRETTALNFYDYYFAQNDYITNFVTFDSNYVGDSITFNCYMYNSRKNKLIRIPSNNGDFLNLELLVCS